MELYTIQMGKWRLAKTRGIELVDITAKGGTSPFAPSKDLVNRYHYANLSCDDYQVEYLQQMRKSVVAHNAEWNSFIQKESAAIACYCQPGAFCHRVLLVEFLQKYAAAKGVPFSYKGELT